uniref:Uncharacterized protein n=1 Tax=Arundo donax TaxID=35708 RepID=A0A0A8ZYY4_ARUDO
MCRPGLAKARSFMCFNTSPQKTENPLILF